MRSPIHPSAQPQTGLADRLPPDDVRGPLGRESRSFHQSEASSTHTACRSHLEAKATTPPLLCCTPEGLPTIVVPGGLPSCRMSITPGRTSSSASWRRRYPNERTEAVVRLCDCGGTARDRTAEWDDAEGQATAVRRPVYWYRAVPTRAKADIEPSVCRQLTAGPRSFHRPEEAPEEPASGWPRRVPSRTGSSSRPP